MSSNIVYLLAMKRGVICLLLLTESIIGAYAQQEIVLSEKHQKKLETITDSTQRAALYQKYFTKDSLKQVKAQVKAGIIKECDQLVQDELGIEGIPKDSVAIAAALKKEAVELLENELNVEVPAITLDTTVTSQLKDKGKQTLLDTLNNQKIVQQNQEYLKLVKRDSASNLVIDSTAVKETVTSTLKQEGKKLLEEEIGIEIPDIILDSTVTTQLKDKGKQAILDTLNNQKIVQQNQEYLKLIKRDSANNLVIDSAAVKETIVSKGEEFLKNTDEYKALNAENAEFNKLTEYKDKIEKTQKELQQMAAQDELKKQMTSKAKEYIIQNAEQIQQVQSQMSELKRIYSSVPNSNDLSTANKRSSLKGEPFWKRIFLGGNFGVTSLNPFEMDLSPQLGYRIDKRFEVGVSGTYRVAFQKDSTWTSQKDEKYGYSVFANYLFYKNFFAYLEGEMMNTADPLAKEVTRSWKETLLIGVGRKFNITPWLEMQAIVSFNVLHDNRDGLYGSPVVFKTGFRVKK